jgi:hypothetical membrane protein
MMNIRILFLAGVLAVAIYLVAVVLGGMIRPGYNHGSQFISELIAAGAPNKAILNPLFILYNLLTGLFGLGLFSYVSLQSQTAARLNIGSIGALALIAEAVFGLLTVFFPQDMRGTPPMTFTGTIHIVLAGLSSLTSMITILLPGLWFRGIPGMGAYFLYSLITVIVVFISGGLTAAAGANNSPFVGLLERITIGAFLQWILVVALKLYSSAV